MPLGRIAHSVVRPVFTLAAIAALGLALGACSKCDVPTWQPQQQVPGSCHSDATPQ
jgi:hypothetical protein